MGGKSGKQRCEWMLLSGGQGCRTIETAASPNPVGGNLIISVQKHGKAVSVGTVPDGSYYHSIVNSFYSLISFPTKNKATYLDILFQNKLGESIWYAQNPNPVPNSSYWTEISWMNVLAGHCEWGATPLDRLPSWCHSTSWFLKSSGFIKVHSSSLHCSHTQAPPWNPSGDFQTLSYSSHNASQRATRWKKLTTGFDMVLFGSWAWSRPEMIVHWTVEIQWIPQGQLPYDDLVPVFLLEKLTSGRISYVPLDRHRCHSIFSDKDDNEEKDTRRDDSSSSFDNSKSLVHSNSTTTTVRQRNPDFSLQQLQNKL